MNKGTIGILGIDPGETTGIAFFLDSRLAFYDEIPDGVEGFIDWWNLGEVDYWDMDLVVIENFVVQPSFVGVPVASEIIGALKALWDGPISIQQRSDKATLFNQDKDGEAGESERAQWFRDRGMAFSSTHAMDAATHVLVNRKRARDMEFWNRYWA